jgi:hypothetical protein
MRSLLFFPLGVVGLYALLDGPRSRLAFAGLVSVGCAELAALVAVIGGFLGPPEWAPNTDTPTVLSPFLAAAAFGTLLGLLLVGIVVRRTQALPGRWAVLPIFLALTLVPLIGMGIPLKAINPRLFELPTFLIGCEWMALGGAIMGNRPGHAAAGLPASA